MYTFVIADFNGFHNSFRFTYFNLKRVLKTLISIRCVFFLIFGSRYLNYD